MVLLMIPSVLASVAVYPNMVEIEFGESAEFMLTLKNTYDTEKTFEIFSTDVQWGLYTKPSNELSLTLSPGETKDINLYIRPLVIKAGLYNLDLVVNPIGMGEAEIKNILIGIKEEEKAYLPAVRTNLQLPEKIDPRIRVPIEVEIENQNKRDLELEIKLRSNLINKDYKTSLKGFEKKKVNFDVKLDPLTSPQKDLLKITLFAEDGYQFDIVPKTYEIISYGELNTKEEVEKKFLKIIKKIILKNEGNNIAKDDFRIKTSMFSKWFTNTVPEASFIEEKDEKFFRWELDMVPTEEKTIYVIISYRPLFYIGLIILILLIIQRMIQSPIVVDKSSKVLRSKEGDVTAIKVFIHLKNRTPKKISDIKVLDRVQNLLDHIENKDVGTLNPTKVIKHESKGSLLVWHIDKLDRFEEILITYKIKPRLRIFGGIKLPSAVVKFLGILGKVRMTHSNTKQINL